MNTTEFPLCSLQLTTSPTREIFAAVVFFGFFLFDLLLVPVISFAVHRVIPDRARRNTTLTWTDHAFINFNRVVSILFVYHLVLLSCTASLFRTSLAGYDDVATPAGARALIADTLVFCFAFLPAVVVVYDLFYTAFHRALHIEWVYPLVHKHHHLQHTPWRGNVDAINVHPFEYVAGEYNHLLALFLVAHASQYATGYRPHAVFALVYIVVAGLLSTLNHTRVDLRVPFLYSVWWHDLHHRVPQSNFGQYTMLWDGIFGWYRPESTDQTSTALSDPAADATAAAVARASSLVAVAGAATASTSAPRKRSSSSAAAAAATAAAPAKGASPRSGAVAPSGAARGRSSSASKRK
jgi:sterol desaturase/sphingolipid hydroxylase (fatty acid hydroxylase superfamily)